MSDVNYSVLLLRISFYMQFIHTLVLFHTVDKAVTQRVFHSTPFVGSVRLCVTVRVSVIV
jgi:hypothetical protein